MPGETVSTKPWFSDAEMPALHDFWSVYESVYDELQIVTRELVEDHPVFGPMIRATPQAVLDAQNAESLAMLKRAIAGEWQVYEENLRTQGMTYVALGIAFRDWYDIIGIFARHMMPHLVKRYGSEPTRLVGALQAMQVFLDRAMCTLGEAYIQTKENAIREGEHRERETEARAAKIQEANRLKSEFLANMSHELRTPLNAIIGFAELLHDGEVGPVEEKQKEFLADILTSGRHLLQLINDVLDLSKVEAGKMEFHPEAIDVRNVVTEVTSILRATAAARHIAIDATIPDLGRVVLDPARLKQVLYNYLSNALKFSPENGHIAIRAIDQGETIKFEVEDSGVGISEQDQLRLFTEFQQLDGGASKRHAGTGLGLALTKRLAEAQGGSVGVKSTPNVGSTFHAILPKERTPQRRTTSLRLEATRGKPTVLVIEDDAADQREILESVSRAGYNVEVATTGAQAIAMCRARRFDVITLDLILPDMSGLDVLRAIRTGSKNETSPVVVLTVVTEKATAGFVVSDVLAKPVEPVALVDALARAGVARGKVAVVDDDAASRKLVVATLERAGHSTASYADGASALDAIAHERPTAIVLDLLMPGLDGFQFLAKLRQSPAHKDIPVVVWTTKDLSTDERERLRSSAQIILQKGLGPAHLANALSAFVRGTVTS